MAIAYKCDRCGTLYGRVEDEKLPRFSIVDMNDWTCGHTRPNSLDLCPDCQVALHAFINFNHEVDEEFEFRPEVSE